MTMPPCGLLHRCRRVEVLTFNLPPFRNLEKNSSSCKNDSMTEHNTFPGSVYAVTCKDGCAVTDARGELNMYCEAGGQLHVTAPSDKLYTSADASVRKVNFKNALAALGLLGGGVSDLPKGYIRAEFLEGTGESYINTNVVPDSTIEFDMRIAYPVPLRETIRYTPFFGIIGRDSYGAFRFAHSSYGNSANRLDAYVLETYYWFRYNPDNIKARKIYRLQTALTPLSGTAPELFLDGIPITSIQASSSNYNYTGPIITPIGLFGRIGFGEIETQGSPFIVQSANLIKNGKSVFNAVSALDSAGIPCMFDGVTKQPVYNSGTGSFIVGFTLPQARNLRKLPAGGGELTISLPSNWQEDTAVVAALATAESKGWVLTIQTYEAEAGAVSSFALRRIWVRKRADENGQYVAADGTRWQIDWCSTMVGGDPQENGYAPFRSVEAAAAYWELESYIDPVQEQLLTD